MQTVGVIGLGAMGAPMAWNIDEAFDLVVYNRSEGPTEPFAKADVDIAESPRALAERVDVVVTMVTDDEALAAVLDGADGLLAGLDGQTTVVQSSTLSVEGAEAAAQTIRAQNSGFVDAPVSGTVVPAQEGTLTVLAAGDANEIDDVEPVLEAIGDPVIRCGHAGDGTRMKLFVNLLLGDLMGAFAEALTFGAAQGLDLRTMREVVGESAVDAPLFQIKGAAVEDGDFAPSFPVDLQFKDLRYANEAANDVGVTLPQTAAAREAFSAASAMGHGEEDMAAVIKYFESIAGLTVGE